MDIMKKVAPKLSVVIPCTAVMLLAGAQSAAAAGCPVTQAAVVSNAGSQSAKGTLSQAFVVPPAYEQVSGRLRFLSNEWPQYYGTEYNDTYLARLTAPGKVEIIANGNVNSSTWSSGLLGYNGATPEINYNTDLSGLVGTTVQLAYEVQDVGDTIVDSALAVDAVQVLRTEQFVPVEGQGGALTGDATISGSFGQAVKLTFTNQNLLGTTISVKDTDPLGQTKESIILPQQSVTFTFVNGGDEPMGWNFEVSTNSDAFIVSYGIESTWTDGMPPNPCF
ncbi:MULTISPECIES: hypothetical protein [Marinobacter]|jgi:hypothetical protein|uniref:hypothetical protein n=1 Tax=Marinobacter TaxID=2742 RepID=UPI000718B92A|nr:MULTISPECIES: hypothetical protein [Marinobacter]MDX5439158.1 hypothetical protein [Alteromonadaceae bacterium]AMQ88457.1 hypothetical protein ASQ50_06965 [Marinobacter sp. LQ44]MDX5388567.1 hypothetical protein [Marinobacter sp.]MDX5473768.1 hypothetical protein [Marinobacter sp.]QFS88241.1 hypothetical protein FIV08_15510 [Marinobacter sp. THAF197a]